MDGKLAGLEKDFVDFLDAKAIQHEDGAKIKIGFLHIESEVGKSFAAMEKHVVAHKQAHTGSEADLDLNASASSKESFFARKQAENASRPEGLHPSQGARPRWWPAWSSGIRPR